MFRPTIGELLSGVRTGLTQSVLPEVTSGNASRQLRAALHLLSRLERCWDRTPGYLIADNQDIITTLRGIATGFSSLTDAARWRGFSDRLDALGAPAQAAAADDVNVELQTLLIEVDTTLRAAIDIPHELRTSALGALADLYLRMTDRELDAWGTGEAM
jgi:hypothetical protein